MQGFRIEQRDTDLLVVGSGASGLRAAIAAKQAKTQVLLLTKFSAGLGTSTLMSHGVFAAYSDAEEHMRRTLEAGHFRNDLDLVRVLCEEAPKRIEELIERGLKVEIESKEISVDGAFPFLGRSIIGALLFWAKETGVELAPWMDVVKLLVEEGEVAGVVALDGRGNLHLIRSRAVVLCTGGAGALFRYHDNPLGSMGEGYVMAREAGAEVWDMEFVQFYPLMVWEGKNSKVIVPPVLVEGGRIVNEDGEEIREKYGLAHLKPIAIIGRDKLSQAIYKEMKSGKKVFFDGRDIREEELNERERRKLAYLDRRFGVGKRPVSVVPCAHFTMGGIKIDGHGRTNIKGLFACGEVASGLHGANRMGGNALSETLVFGKRAGEAASSYALERARSRGRPDLGSLSELLKRCTEGRLRPLAFMRSLREILWESCGPIRREEGLESGLGEIERLRREGMRSEARDLPLALSILRGLQAARMMIEGAKANRQNVGAHFREEA
jgi:succinate dehydrogenase/fumarate reductase flavoprotein subunit